METEEKVEEKVEEVAEIQETEAVEQKTEVQEDKPKKNKVSAKDRINQLVRGKGEAEREAERLRKEVEDLKKQTRLEKEPTEDEIDDPMELAKKRQQWQEQTQAERDAEIQKRANELLERKQAEQRDFEMRNRWENEKKKAVEKYENFKESEEFVVAVTEHYGNQAFATSIIESDNSSAIVDYLGHNVEEAERIAQLSPLSAAKEIGKLEIRLKDKPKKPSSAPDPVDASNGSSESGTMTMDQVSKLSPADYRKWRRERGMN